ncbi:ABC transporter permease, partial [Turicimonas muris]
IITLEAALLVFKVPMEGSFFVILVSSILYLLTSLGIGLLISGGLKAQFLACQIALLVSFLPSVLLSGFVFDLRNVPGFIAVVAYALPPTYFIELLRGAFLSGDNWTVIWKDWVILFLYLTVFFYLTNKTLKKTLEKK